MIPELCNTCPELYMNCPELCIACLTKRADICSIGYSSNLDTMIRCFTFLLIVFISTFDVYGQYEPMALEGARWVVFDKDNDSAFHHLLKLEGDSAINGNMYKKLYRQEILSGATSVQDFLPPYYLIGTQQLIGLMRDDVQEEKVYGIFFTTPYGECSTGEEELVHDYSLTVGSPLAGCLHEDQGIPIASIDSIKTELLWGKQREVQYVSTGYRFIEGIGGNAGPFSSSSFTVPGVLTEMVEYCVGTDTECGLGPVGTNEMGLSQLKIYPNPMGGYLKIELGNECAGSIYVRLFDATGRVFQKAEFDCRANETITVRAEGLGSGFYFLNIQSGGSSSNHKILVR